MTAAQPGPTKPAPAPPPAPALPKVAYGKGVYVYDTDGKQ